MRTYEIEVAVVTIHKRTITSAKAETHDTLVAAMCELEGLDASSLQGAHVMDVTPKPKTKTDKQRFNDAFRELRKLGYDARQGLTPHDDGVDVYTMREDAEWAFRRNGDMCGMMPVNWQYGDYTKTDFHRKRAGIIKSVFASHGFDVTWEGDFWNCIEIRRGGGKL